MNEDRLRKIRTQMEKKIRRAQEVLDLLDAFEATTKISESRLAILAKRK